MGIPSLTAMETFEYLKVIFYTNLFYIFPLTSGTSICELRQITWMHEKPDPTIEDTYGKNYSIYCCRTPLPPRLCDPQEY
jgi:hypothetical protein